MSEGLLERVVRPRIVFPLLAVLMALAALLAPNPDVGGGGATTYSSQRSGVRALYLALPRLGVPVRRQLERWRAPLSSDAVYLVLDPPNDPGRREIGALIDAVRRGAGLVVVPSANSPLADSIRIRQSERSFVPTFVGVSAQMPGGVPVESPDSITKPFRSMYGDAIHHVLRFTGPMTSDTVVFLRSILGGEIHAPVMLGRSLGAGRVLVLADAGILSNEALRNGTPGVVAVRALRWVSGNRAVPAVFDEYHFGHGPQPAPLSTMIGLMTNAPLGRAAIQLSIAGFILLLALAARPFAPADTASVARRSPLEHVGALARAYEQAGATRIATRRMLSGLRRRHAFAARFVSDDSLLTAIATRAPAGVATAEQIDAVRHTLHSAASPRELLRTAHAIGEMEQWLR